MMNDFIKNLVSKLNLEQKVGVLLTLGLSLSNKALIEQLFYFMRSTLRLMREKSYIVVVSSATAASETYRNFLDGTFSGVYEDKLIESFDASLS